MDNKHKVVTCASYGGTGLSVITDLLSEFKDVKSLGDYEFALTHEVDGISDLQHYLVDDFHRMKVDEGIYRFNKLINTIGKSYNRYFNNEFISISEKYIEDITKVTWEGYWHQHKYRYGKLQRFILYNLPGKLQYKFHNLHKKTKYEYVPYFRRSIMRLSYNKDDFYYITKEYFEKLFDILDPEYKYSYLALDQLVPPFNISRYLNYFNDLKIIVVDRDPRDLYLLNKVYWKEGWIPEDINTFIEWFKILREPLQNEISNENVLRIKFEDCIFKYDETLNLIMNFLKIDSSNHIDKYKYFNPDVSINNCKLWEKHDDYKHEIDLICCELNEFCYNYNNS